MTLRLADEANPLEFNCKQPPPFHQLTIIFSKHCGAIILAGIFIISKFNGESDQLIIILDTHDNPKFIHERVKNYKPHDMSISCLCFFKIHKVLQSAVVADPYSNIFAEI